LPNSSCEKIHKSSQKFTRELLESFISSRPDGCSHRTIEFYRYTLTQFVGYPLSTDGVSSYLKSLTCGNGKARHYQALKTLLLWLYRNNYTQDKIIDKVPLPKVQKRLLPAVSKEQLEILMKYCHCERDKVLISFLWYSGTRLSEAVNIKAKDFNWNEGTVIILGKGNKYRKALAGNELVREWFSNRNSFEISRAGIMTMLKRLSKTSGIKCNPHSFRRGFAIHNLKSGLSTRIVQSLGGWESIVMVERYSRSLAFEDALQVYNNVNGSS
jgi:integrase/recombinase XerC